jgi:D-glycero-D-manno-heptose 1,7-bisphosphate phosphatase
MKRAVFLDRDGVINVNRPDYVKSWQDYQFLPGVFEPLRLMARSQWAVVVISNQSCIGRGLVDVAVVEDIHRAMALEIRRQGGRVDAVFYCPHRPDEGCDCRKPQPGLLLRAARELGLELTRSYLVGDAVSDVEAALAAGCSPIMVLTGRGAGQVGLLRQRGYHQVPIVRDLAEAVALIPFES